MFKWKEGTTTAQIQHAKEQLECLPAAIPQLVSYQVGSDMCVQAASL
jgi:hypothetical protein